jgi:AcrR family transcriptional regulator
MIFIGDVSAGGALELAKKINFASVLPPCVIVYPWVRYQERSLLSTGCCNFVMPKDAAQSLAHLDAFTSRRHDPATKREAVLKTAAQLFLEKSYGRTSMNDVADRLNITKPALYHYFRNKEEILIECYRLGTGLIEEILNDIAAHCGTGLEKVEAFIYSYANVMTVNFGRCVMRLDDADLSSDALTQVRNYKRKIDRRLRSFIQEGIDDRSITSCDAKIAAFSIAGALNWICHWYEPEGALSAEEIATQFARTLTQGLVEKKKRSGPRLVRGLRS